jgi:hypothetical protein
MGSREGRQMKKEVLVDLIKQKYPHLTNQETELWIGRAWNTLLYESFKMDTSSVDFFCKQFYDIAVAKDTYDEYYCLLPVRPVQLPDNADGVRRVMCNKNGVDVTFVPVPRDSFGVFAELDIDKIDSSVGYSTKYNKIIWERNPNVEKVKMDIVPMFEDYDDEDEVSAPMGFDVRLAFLVDQLMSGIPDGKFWQAVNQNKVNN